VSTKEKRRKDVVEGEEEDGCPPPFPVTAPP